MPNANKNMLERLELIARVNLFFIEENPERKEDYDHEYHLVPGMPSAHRPSNQCWCEPEVFWQFGDSIIYRHRRIQ